MADLYVNTDIGSPGDGTSWEAAKATLATAMAVVPADITALESYVIHCKGATLADTSAVTITKTTDATHTLTVQVDQADRHAGAWSDSKYRLTVNGAVPIAVVSTQYLNIYGLQISSTDNTLFQATYAVSSHFSRLGYNIFKGSAANYKTCVSLSAVGAASTAYVYNNVMYDMTGTEGTGIIFNDSDWTVHIYNNSIVGCARGIRNSASAYHYVKNNLVRCVDCYYGVFVDNDNYCDYNMSSDPTTLGGTHDHSERTFTFVNEGAKNFHLATGDSGARGMGTNLGSVFTDDIDGAARSGTWDCGADQVSANVSTAQPWDDYMWETVT